MSANATPLVAVLKPEQHYVVTVNGKPLGTFRVESSWEGWMKLTNSEGQTLITEQPSGFGESMAAIFGNELQALIVKASPSLLAKTMGGAS